jgi:hypothetical protein
MKPRNPSSRTACALLVAAAFLGAVACGSSSTKTNANGNTNGGNATCSDVCTNLQAVCPAGYSSSCVTQCEAQDATGAELECAASAGSCAAITACQTGSGNDSGAGSDSSAGNDSGSGSAQCHAVDGPNYTSYTCNCGGSTITGCSNGQACNICSGLGSCSSCQTNP